MKLAGVIALLLGLPLLLSCSTELSRRNDQQLDLASNRAIELREQLGQGQSKVRSQSQSSIEKVEGIWLPFRRLAEVSAQVTAREAAGRRITVNRDFRNIQEVAERVTLLTGIPVNVAPDALVPFPGVVVPGASTPGATGAAPPAAANPAGVPVPPLPPLPPVAGAAPAPLAVQAAPGPAPIMVPLSYDGSLSGFLDVAAARFGVSWEWSGNAINLFRYTTRTFRLTALPGDSSMSSVVTSTSGGTSGSGSSSSAASGSGANVGGTSTSGVAINSLSVWTAINDAIKGMLTTRGAVAVNAATGTVMVTDTPQVLDRVAKFIDMQNASLSKQVLVNVRVLAVDMDQADSYGINWSAVYTALGDRYRLSAAGPAFAANTGAGLFGAHILGNPLAASNGTSSQWRGSNAFISALSQQGRVSQVTSTSLLTLNNQPAPLQVGRQIAYLASAATTLTSGFGSTTTLTPGLVTTGFSMSVVPHILDKGKLMLQFSINISSLFKLEKVTSGEGATASSIQTPQIDTRHFLQRVMLNTGDTLILTGFEQDRLQNDHTGTGDARNVALGGGVNAESKRTTLVILIQPIVGEAA